MLYMHRRFRDPCRKPCRPLNYSANQTNCFTSMMPRI